MKPILNDHNNSNQHQSNQKLTDEKGESPLILQESQ